MALLTEEVPGHVRRLFWDGVAIGYATQCKFTRGTETKKLAHKDINPGVIDPTLTKEKAVAKNVKATCKFYFKESGSFATLRSAWNTGAEEKVRFANVIAGNSYEEYDGVVTSLSDEATEGEWSVCDVEFSCYGTMATGTTA